MGLPEVKLIHPSPPWPASGSLSECPVLARNPLMLPGGFRGRALIPGRDVALLGEDTYVIVADVADRPPPAAKVIVVANEKGGVGKLTIAFDLSVALDDAGLRVAACDLDRRQQSLSSALSRSYGTARRLKLDLPRPRHSHCRYAHDADQQLLRRSRSAGQVPSDFAEAHGSGLLRHCRQRTPRRAAPARLARS